MNGREGRLSEPNRNGAERDRARRRGKKQRGKREWDGEEKKQNWVRTCENETMKERENEKTNRIGSAIFAPNRADNGRIVVKNG